jgi:hypothetical protein
MNGRLSEQPLAELIRELKGAGLSGALRLARERVQAVVYVQAGALTHARTNLRAHRLTECLRRWGLVSEERLSAVGAEAMPEQAAVAALTEAGLVAAADLPALRARQTTDVLRLLLLWTDGVWSFDPRARLVEEVAGEIATDELLLEAARRLPAEFAAARLSDADLLAPVAAPPAQLALLPTEAFVLSRVDAPLTLAELVAVSGLAETQTRHTAYALALAGLLARATWPRAIDLTTAAQPRAEQRPAAASPNPQSAPPATPHAPTASTTTQDAARTPADKSAPATPTTATPAAPSTNAPDASPAPAAAVEATPDAEVAALLARAAAPDFYELLGVARNADAREIKRAYYALAKRFHPDRFRRAVTSAQLARAEAAFAHVAQAYETLSDEKTRTVYDAKLTLAPRAPASQATPPAAQRAPEATFVKRATAEENFQHGLAALKQDNHRMASLYFAEAVRLAPRQPRYHAYYGHALTKDPRTRRQAELELNAAIALDPNDATHHFLLAELFHALGHMRRAESALTRVLSLDPRHADARRLLAQLKKQ